MRMELQKKIMAWLSANNIEPSNVPLEAIATIRDGRITCPVYLRRDGSRYLNKDRKPAMGTVDVPLLAEPTDDVVRMWLDGRLAVR